MMLDLSIYLYIYRFLKKKIFIYTYIYIYCRDSIYDDPKMTLGSHVKRAQTISFVERGFERLCLGHQAVGFS